jgi:hypothetical protein
MAGADPSAAYEHAVAVNTKRRGPLRFEEGVATDTDIPNEFGRGAYGDTQIYPPQTLRKDPAETMRERAHVGSASWIEAPTMLSDFVVGAQAGSRGPEFEVEMGTERRIHRISPATVSD